MFSGARRYAGIFAKKPESIVGGYAPKAVVTVAVTAMRAGWRSSVTSNFA